MYVLWAMLLRFGSAGRNVDETPAVDFCNSISSFFQQLMTAASFPN
jgi:hypothetical protein